MNRLRSHVPGLLFPSPMFISMLFGSWAAGSIEAGEVPAPGLQFSLARSVQNSQRITFSKHVAPIFQRSCQNCHRPGEVAPMSLLSYGEARPWAKSIRRMVRSREMPPWDADPNIGRYVNDPTLSEEEVETIVRWVDTGAAPGNPADLPPPLEFPTEREWNIGEPDLILTMRIEHVVPAEGYDRYPSFYLATGLTEERWVRAVEIKPGNRRVIHHVMAYVEQERDDGERSRGGRTNGSLMIEYAVGNRGDIFPPGTGKLLKPGSVIRLESHYHSSGVEERDRTSIGFRFYPKGESPRPVISRGISDRDLAIPAGADNVKAEAWFRLPYRARIISFQPHMHYRGKSMILEAIFPDGRTEILSSVPTFKFNWQITYAFETPPVVPAGTELHMVAYHDNSPNIAYNPDPSALVRWGQQTTDEMAIGWTDIVYLDEE
ncbi:cytochrome c [Candidatus Sumerlaeota bacterium]|nr:cytochrome c [Candidatus Sumerlaeota bacterium]